MRALLSHCREIADRIDTGTGDDSLERALVLFHLKRENEHPVSGWVTFDVDMPWRQNRALPQISITRLVTGVECAVYVTEPQFTPGEGSHDRGTLRFAMRWSAVPVLPGGWDTYIAAYSSDPAPHLNATDEPARDADAQNYAIFESLRHTGDLPPRCPSEAS